MAIITFNTNDQTVSFSGDSTTACNLNIGGATGQRFFDDSASGGSGLPVLGDIIYLDNALTNTDIFESDLSASKDPANQYWYTTDLGITIRVDENGKVQEVVTCSASPTSTYSSFDTVDIYSANVADACSGTGGSTIQRYFDDAGGSKTTPTPGDVIYLDSSGTDVDVFLPDETTLKQLGTNYFYETTVGDVYLIDEQGILQNIYPCGSATGVNVGPVQFNISDACLNNILDATFFTTSGASTSTLIIGDVIWEDSDLTIQPGDGYYYLYDINRYAKINSGIVSDIGSCSATPVQVQISAPYGGPFIACGAFAVANFFTNGVQPQDIIIGTTLYQDPSLALPISGGNSWYYESVQNISLQIDNLGVVVDSTLCPTAPIYQVYNVTAEVAGYSGAICDGNGTPLSIFYVSDDGAKSIDFIADAGMAIFWDYANALSHATELNSGASVSLNTVIPGHIFLSSDAPNTSYLEWDGTVPEWGNSGQAVECVYITYEVFTILLDHDSDNTATTAADFCTGTRKSSTFYYLAEEGSSLTLLDIAQQDIPIFKTYDGALDQDSSQFAAKQIYIETSIPNDGWFYFGSATFDPRQWFGFTSAGNLHFGPFIEEGGSCEAYERPDSYPTENLESSDPFASNIFYSFYSCNPEETSPGVITWNMYVIDGAHFEGENNHISDFISTLKGEGKTTYQLGESSECITYTHTIKATDIDEAALVLAQSGYTVVNKTIVQQKTAASVGIYSNNQLKAFEDCNSCGDPLADSYTYEFGDIEGDEFDPTLGVNFNTDVNYNIDNVSKPLLRTNPKLTTNIKLVADTSDKIYLESINATKGLANIEYKRNELNRNGAYSYDLANFFNSKKTPNDIVFKTKRASSDTSVLEDYQSQLEEDYQYGATLNYSKLYDEKFRIFAPIWADLNIPKMFVIFKINNPGESTSLDNSGDDNLTRIKSILANAEIVKTFDLTNQSAIGNYIRNHVQDESFPEAPLTISFEKDEKSTYNGIDLTNGGFISKAEYLYNDFVKKDKPLIEANDFITDGFRRNSLASANILNLEFLFDDSSAADYSVNRYFGLYVNDIDSGLGEVSTSKNGRIKFKSVESYVDSNLPESGIPSHHMMNNTPTLGYVSIEDSYYKISTNRYYDESNLNLEVVDNLNEIGGKLGIKYKDKSIEAENIEGSAFDYIKFTVKDNPVVNDSIAIVNTKEEAFSFKFIKHTPNTLVTITDSTGSFNIQFDTGNNIDDATTNFIAAFTINSLSTKCTISYDSVKKEIFISEIKSGLGDLGLYVSTSNGNIIKVKNIYTRVDLYNNTIFAADVNELPKGTFKGNTFSQDGEFKDVAIAMSAAINQLQGFTAKNRGADVYVSIDIPGYKLLQHTLLINKSNNHDFITAENLDLNGQLLNLDSSLVTNWSPHYFNGGASEGASMLVKSDTISEIDINDYIATNYSNRFNKIKDVVEYVEDLGAGYHRLILSEPNSIKSGEIRLYRENKLRIGLFSAYDIYDLNFDFYDTSNSDLKELNKEEFENIEYEPYSTTKSWTDENSINYRVDYAGLATNEILSEDYELTPINYFSNLLPLLDSESILGTSANFINSEFDRLEENNLKELSLKSRVVPNINKWVLKDCDTVREQPYYLNANEAFGRTNFAPDLSVEGRDRKSFTHEWFYMDKIPNFYRYNDASDTFSYINFIQGFDLTKEMFMDTELDYFDKFMISEGLEISSNSSDLDDTDSTNFNMNTFIKKPLKKKYSTITNGNDISFASTFFKGIKVLFKSRKEFTNNIASEYVKNNEFNGYRFSTLVKVKQDDTISGKNEIEYEVIQNEAHKFVIFFITLNISDFWIKNSLSRKMLYELNHKMIFDNSDTYGDGQGEYVYSDANLSGALNLLSTDFNGPGPYIVSGIPHNNGTDPEFETQVSTVGDDLYGRIIIEFPGTAGTWAARVSTVNSNEELVLQEVPYKIDDPSVTMPVAYLSSTLLLNADYTYEGGGVNAHSKLLEKLSIQYVSKMLNSGSSDVKYKTIKSDGTVLDNRFVINFEDGKEIIKESKLRIEEDTNKPQTFKLSSGTIGYNIVSGETYYPFLIRHSGNYTVDMRPVVTFTDLYTHFKVNRDHVSGNAVERSFEESLYKHSLNSVFEVGIARKYYNRYNRTGTTFNLGFIQDSGEHDANWGVIKNHFYHKVNDINTKGVIKLSASSDLLPLYPLISEIAIDKKDINVFRSSWDRDYYTRSLSGGKSTNVVGTFGVIEERSYLASTMMTLEDSYLLLDYTTANVNNKEELDDILRNSNNTADIMIFEDKNNIIADFYMDSVIYKKLRDSGVLSTLTEFVKPEESFGDKTTLIDDSQNYIIKNLIDVFTLDNLVLYTKAFKGKGSEFINSNSTTSLSSNGFKSDNSFTYKQHTQTPLNFRLIYNKRLGYSYDIKPMIKIKS